MNLHVVSIAYAYWVADFGKSWISGHGSVWKRANIPLIHQLRDLSDFDIHCYGTSSRPINKLIVHNTDKVALCYCKWSCLVVYLIKFINKEILQSAYNKTNHGFILLY